MKQFAVILAGCGVYDGAEIHEAVLTLLAIKKAGADYKIFAPDVDQYHVINHITGEVTGEKRNALTESARIARGIIYPVGDFTAADFDALIFPGGFGVAKNLCTYAYDGVDFKVNKDVEKAIKEMFELGKPIGAMCIAPVLLAKVLENIGITIGNDKGTANDIDKLGSSHKVADYTEVVIDTDNLIFSTPCYMLDADILQVANGTENLINAIMQSF
jgi:enhancing lycopene biosynthesis protein 2